MDRNEHLKSEIEAFRLVGYQFVNKEINANEFKAKSGGMGVYAQRGGEKFMIRLRTPSGIITHDHLQLLYNFTQRYNLDRIHLTTRQAIQIHDLSVDEVCEIMEEAINHGLYSRGGGGNYPRNVSLSPLSGVDKNEAFDPTQYALLVNEYILSKVTTYRLPRKLKIAFSNSDLDTANATVNDLGFLAVIEANKPYFKLHLAGGLGNNAEVAIKYDRLIEPEEVLYHVEAFTNLFMAEGDYNNKAKARSRFIPKRLGVEEFLKTYNKHLEDAKKNNQFDGIKAVISRDNHQSPELIDNTCLIAQRQEGFFTVIIHPKNGQLNTGDFADILPFIQGILDSEIRLSMNESMYIRNLTAKQAVELLTLTQDMRQESRIEQSVTCVGVPTCQIGIEKSQILLDEILKSLYDNNLNQMWLPSIHISGCGNSCSRHQTVSMGFTGRKKKVNDEIEDAFDLYVGGCVSKERTEFGKAVGTLTEKDIPKFLVELATRLEKDQVSFETFLEEKEEEFHQIVANYLV